MKKIHRKYKNTHTGIQHIQTNGKGRKFETFTNGSKRRFVEASYNMSYDPRSLVRLRRAREGWKGRRKRGKQGGREGQTKGSCTHT